MKNDLNVWVLVGLLIVGLLVGCAIGHKATTKNYVPEEKIERLNAFSLGYGYTLGLLDMGYGVDNIYYYDDEIISDVLTYYDIMVNEESYLQILNE